MIESTKFLDLTSSGLLDSLGLEPTVQLSIANTLLTSDLRLNERLIFKVVRLVYTLRDKHESKQKDIFYYSL